MRIAAQINAIFKRPCDADMRAIHPLYTVANICTRPSEHRGPIPTRCAPTEQHNVIASVGWRTCAPRLVQTVDGPGKLGATSKFAVSLIEAHHDGVVTGVERFKRIQNKRGGLSG